MAAANLLPEEISRNMSFFQPQLLQPKSLSPKSLSLKYRPDIDGLRAIAVLSVVSFHAFPGWIRGGFIGVDIFFVISGYLIHTIILQNIDNGTFSFFDFYARRIKRIFPALILILITSYVLGWFILLSDEYKQLGKHIAAGAGFVANFELLNETGYFDNSADTKPLLHLWSLGIEEQFYIISPFLLWLSRNRLFHILLISTLVCTSFYLNINEIGKNAIATFYFPQTRFWELLCGSFLAWLNLYKHGVLSSIKTRMGAALGAPAMKKILACDEKALANILSFAGLFLLLYGFRRIDKQLSFPGEWAIIPVLGAMLIISAGPGAWLNRIALSHRLMVWFGLISFPLYLWHWPLLFFAGIAGGESQYVNFRVGAVVASIALAWLTYELVERPVRFGRHGKAKTFVLVALMVVLGCVGYGTYVNDGFGFRQAAMLKGFDGDVGHLEYHKYIAEHYHVCTPTALAEEALRWDRFIRCMQSKPGSDVDLAIIGDSHAESLFLGVADALPAKNIAFYIKNAPPFLSHPEFQNIFKYVLDSGSIKQVILTMFWHGRLGQVPEGSSLEKELSMVIDALTGSGKKVYLTDDFPDFPFKADECKGSRRISRKEQHCAVSLETELKNYQLYIDILKKLSIGRQNVKLLETWKYFCNDVACSMVNGNKILYRDNNHLNINGSLYAGRKLVDDNAAVFQ